MENELRDAMKMRLRAKTLTDEAKSLNTAANKIIMPLLVAHGLEAYESDLGTVSIRKSSGFTLNRDKLVESMLLAGLPPEKVESIMEQSGNPWTREYVEFRASKSG